MTHSFSVGDRVEMTAAGLRASPRPPQFTTGRVTRVKRWSVEVLRDGTVQPTWYPAHCWRLVAASVPGSRQWLESRAMVAAFARV